MSFKGNSVLCSLCCGSDYNKTTHYIRECTFMQCCVSFLSLHYQSLLCPTTELTRYFIIDTAHSRLKWLFKYLATITLSTNANQCQVSQSSSVLQCNQNMVGLLTMYICPSGTYLTLTSELMHVFVQSFSKIMFLVNANDLKLNV